MGQISTVIGFIHARLVRKGERKGKLESGQVTLPSINVGLIVLITLSM